MHYFLKDLDIEKQIFTFVPNKQFQKNLEMIDCTKYYRFVLWGNLLIILSFLF